MDSPKQKQRLDQRSKRPKYTARTFEAAIAPVKQGGKGDLHSVAASNETERLAAQVFVMLCLPE